MKIYEIGEKRLLEAIRAFTGVNRYVEAGFGDDGAVLRSNASRSTTVTTDILLEGTHFPKEVVSWKDLGRKSYEVNASDVAAMGASPIAAFLSLGVKPDMEFTSLMDFYKGFDLAAKRHDCRILGGDLARSERFFISVTLIGVYEKGARPLLRTAARCGDRIYVTGWPGESGMGFLLMNEKGARAARRMDNPLIIKHLRPKARVKEGVLLAHSSATGAVIDISDGVYNELRHLALSSGKKFMISLSLLPVSPRLRKQALSRGIDPFHALLFGGEDYELIFTSSLGLSRIKSAFQRKKLRCPIHEIGWVEKGRGVVFLDEQERPVIFSDKTFEHFSRENP